MDSQTLRQRTKDEPTTTTNSTGKGARRDKKMAMAKRGLRSLAIAIGTPLFLTLTNIFLFGSGQNYHNNEKPFWYPPLWALHSACIVSSILMGLSAWLVWAEGGFHKQPSVVPLYLGQLFLSLAWDPIVLKLGASWVGLMVCVGLFGTLVACLKRFRQVNPIAGDLLKPCLAWVAYLALVNTKLLHL